MIYALAIIAGGSFPIAVAILFGPWWMMGSVLALIAAWVLRLCVVARSLPEEAPPQRHRHGRKKDLGPVICALAIIVGGSFPIAVAILFGPWWMMGSSLALVAAWILGLCVVARSLPEEAPRNGHVPDRPSVTRIPSRARFSDSVYRF